MSGDLLQTKLFIPPLRPSFISRPHLIERLNQGLRQGNILTLISAPAGFGKSTLVGEWIASLRQNGRQLSAPAQPVDGSLHSERRIAWLSLDQGDNGVARFFAYVAASLERAGVVIGSEVQARISAPQVPPIDTLVTPLLNALSASPYPMLFVLDDFHAISDVEIHQAVEFLLERRPEHMHVAIVTRQDPPMALSRWRGRGLMTEIRQQDLRFSTEEATAFLNSSMGLGLKTPEIAALERRTEGWIVGLQLAAVALAGQRHDRESGEEARARFVEDFSGRHHYVLDYLTDEVLKQQTEPVQMFLLKTSMLTRMCGPLCDAVIASDNAVVPAELSLAGTVLDANAEPSGQAVLEYLDHANLFVIPLDEERRWYRYHHLFAELLQARLQESFPDEVSKLNRLAALWFEQNGFSFDAVRHALQAKDVQFAADLTERAIRQFSTWSSADVATISGWLRALPDQAVRNRPWLSLFASRALYVTGQWESADSILHELEASLQSNPDSPETIIILRHLVADRASYAVVRGDAAQAITYAHRALAQVEQDAPVTRVRPLSILAMAHIRLGDVLQAERFYSQAIELAMAEGPPTSLAAVPLLCSQADALLVQGRLREAMRICEEAQEAGTVNGEPIPLTGYAELILGKARYELNELEASEQHLLTGLQRLDKGGITDNFGNVQAVLALVKQAQGDGVAAAAAIQQSVQIAQRGGIPRIAVLVSAYQARFWLAQGELDEAVRWAKEYQQMGPTEHLREFEDLTLVRVLLASERVPEALSLLESLQTAAEAAGRMGRLIEILILKAVALDSLGHTGNALLVLQRAIAQAEPEGYVQLFVEQGNRMARLLRKAVTTGIARAYMERLLAALPQEQDQSVTAPAVIQPAAAKAPLRARSGLLEPLTERELDVLRQLAEGLTNRQIAEQLFVSTNTVRTHTYHIYGKLDVHGRMQAVARARELGLLPPG